MRKAKLNTIDKVKDIKKNSNSTRTLGKKPTTSRENSRANLSLLQSKARDKVDDIKVVNIK